MTAVRTGPDAAAGLRRGPGEEPAQTRGSGAGMSVTTSRWTRPARTPGPAEPAAGAGGESPMGAGWGREATLPRRRRPALWTAGLVLVAVGALVAAGLVGRAGHRVDVLAVARPVPVGQTITADDLVVARVAADPGLQPVPAGQRDQILGRVAAIELRPGTLLTGGEVTDTAVPGPGQQVIGVAAGTGQLPARGLHPGDRILLVPVPGDSTTAAGGSATAADGPSGQPIPAQVIDVGPADVNGRSTVDVLVGSEVGPRVAALASTGRLALVLVPAGGP